MSATMATRLARFVPATARHSLDGHFSAIAFQRAVRPVRAHTHAVTLSMGRADFARITCVSVAMCTIVETRFSIVDGLIRGAWLRVTRPSFQVMSAGDSRTCLNAKQRPALYVSYRTELEKCAH
jgi:hypothetical protein